MNQVLLVDDDDDLRRATGQSLTLAGFEVTQAPDGLSALREVEAGFEGVVVSDIRMPGLDGLGLMRRALAHDPELGVILVSGHADVPTAVTALRDGAYDVLEKPFALDQLIAAVERASERRRLMAENRRLRAEPPDPDEGPLLGRSPAIEHLRRVVAQVAPVAVDVLIEGETGTGKGVVAAMIHALSRRRGPLVTLDCGALPPALFEADLFGHVAGAVPGQHMPRTGRIESAHRGTLFLDEVDALSEPMQHAVQRVLEHREVMPLGGTAPRALDLRVICASHADLERLSRQGRFRSALYYRLNGVTLKLPPLRERPEDIAPLFRSFVLQAAQRLGVTPPAIDVGAFRHLERHDWPGNVRELRRYAENFVLGIGDGRQPEPAPATTDLKHRVDLFEAQLIEEALATAGGDVTRTCLALGLPRKTLYYKLQRLGIDVTQFRG